MKRRISRPIIFTLTMHEPATFEVKPRILPFPGSRADESPQLAEVNDESDAELGEVRERLFRMIVAKEWDRSNGNRAS